MQVIMVSQLGGPEVLQAGEADLPQPRPGEVFVRVLAAGVGPWDARPGLMADRRAALRPRRGVRGRRDTALTPPLTTRTRVATRPDAMRNTTPGREAGPPPPGCHHRCGGGADRRADLRAGLTDERAIGAGDQVLINRRARGALRGADRIFSIRGGHRQPAAPRVPAPARAAVVIDHQLDWLRRSAGDRRGTAGPGLRGPTLRARVWAARDGRSRDAGARRGAGRPACALAALQRRARLPADPAGPVVRRRIADGHRRPVLWSMPGSSTARWKGPPGALALIARRRPRRIAGGLTAARAAWWGQALM
jgi:hypothetical protein